jgi:hypothetical protein
MMQRFWDPHSEKDAVMNVVAGDSPVDNGTPAEEVSPSVKAGDGEPPSVSNMILLESLCISGEEDISLKVIVLLGNTKVIDGSPETASVVTGWWDNLDPRCSCLNILTGYNSTIDAVQIYKLLSPGEWWATRSLLTNAINNYVKVCGFKVASNHTHLKCRRHE